MATETERPLRRDAERNRRRIMDAARVVFAQRGLDVSMDEIARQAGVGVGTVYRRFPNKEELIDALFHEGLDEISQIARDAMEVEDPWEGLVAFMENAVTHQSMDRGLKEVLLGSAHGRARVTRGRERIAPLLQRLVDRAQGSGQLRPDVSATDFALIQMSLGAVMDYAQEADPEVWRRSLGLVLDGLRTRRDAPSALPVGPLDLEQVECAMRSWRPARR
jgi:AcrR family transcriptional regulator